MYKVKRFILGRIVWNLVALLIGQIIMFEIVKDDFKKRLRRWVMVCQV